VRGADAERELIEAAHPRHPSLIDRQFVVPELYNTRNVPAVFWIDESGTIVRGNDPVYITRRNRETGETTINERYLSAVRDWVRNGAESRYLTPSAETQRRVGTSDDVNEQAMAHFRLGIHLDGQGHHEAAVEQFKRALELKPDNWNYRRQAYNLGSADEYGMTMQEAMQAIGPMYAMPLELPEPPAEP
jgi:tetratricopeptide (TPR) repeat protein